MGELTAIGFTPGQSCVHRLDPRTKQAIMMGLSVAGAGAGFPFLIILSLILVALFRAADLKIMRLVREIRYFLFFLVIVFLVRAVSLDSRWVPTVTLSAASDGLLVCWRLLAVVLMGILLVATTRIAHIRAALVWFMAPVPGINEKMLGTMVGLVVRFLPVILYQASEISDAQRSRGIERRKNPFVRLRTFSIPLFRRVFWCADDLAVAMQSRCYSERRTLPELAFSRHDGLALGAAVLLCLTVLIS